ncbi:hypothetical protein PHYPSEUDO_010444 [Phytophthora pseudosyringae]|uniref:Uncharacterized protein n=1 Tax=Phytophthora pseudosyringae TaxID=221518 RepID=A0A8T1VAW9_9STRA|nr:hypothetical protein PHYPSEUDO_010444 [Phytophthora pseudosyringae]
MTNTIMDALDSTGGCCDDFLDEIKTLFGDSLDEMVAEAAELSTNIACAERTFTNLKGATKQEMCGYSIYHSFTFGNSDDDFSWLTKLAQIPNDQMCKAFEGKSFTTTKGSATTIGFGTNGVDTMGICLNPIDTFTTYMKSWGVFSETMDADGTSVALSDLFTSGKSITGNAFFSYATTSTNLPLMAMRTMDKVIQALSSNTDESDTSMADWFVDMLNSVKSDAAGLSLHIPNNGDCSYSDQSITVPYAETAAAATTAAGNAASSVQLSGLVTAGVALVSTLLLSGLL